jgi:serine/threonine protein kinase
LDLPINVTWEAALESAQKLMDRYQLLRPIGGGGMGRVWLAHDENLLRDVAVKQVVAPPNLDGRERDRARRLAVREAQAAAQISHPNAVRIYDIVHSETMPWIVMEYVPSRSLHQLMKEKGSFTPGFVALVGLAVLDALTAAHRAGVMHRDVTPHNILVGDDKRIFLTDFGLAAWNPYDGRTLLAGEMAGKPLYMPPERMRSGKSIPEGDLWALGATLYAAVEGRPPFMRDNLTDTLTAQVNDPPDPPRFAGALTPVLCGLLQNDPKLRMGAPEVRKYLVKVIGGRDEGAIFQREVVPRRQRLQSAQTVMLVPAPAA